MAGQISGRSSEQRGGSCNPASRADASAALQPQDGLSDGGHEPGTLATPTENSALLGSIDGRYDAEIGEQKKGSDWDDLPAQGDPSWAREIKMVLKSCPPLIITFFLQFSINATSVFAVGKLGKQQLAAVARKYTTSLFRYTVTGSELSLNRTRMHANSSQWRI